MATKIFRIVFLSVFSSLFLSSCIKEVFDQDKLTDQIQINTSAAVPVGYKTMSIKEIFAEQLSQGKLKEDKDGLLWFEYEGSAFSKTASDLVTFSPITKSFNIKSPVTIDLSLITSPITLTDTVYFDLTFPGMSSDVKIDSIILNNAYLSVFINSALAVNSTFKLTFPDAIYNNLVYTKNLIVNTSNTFKDFAGYSVKLVNDGVHKNSLKLIIQTTLSPANLIITAGTNIASFNMNISSIDYLTIFGYFGQLSISSDFSNAINFDFYNRKIDGYFNFTHPQLIFKTQNSMGIPFSFKIKDFNVQSVNSQTQKIILQGTYSDAQPAFIAAPSINQIGKTLTDSTLMDIGTLSLFTQNYTTNASISMTGMSNPGGPSTYNFLNKNSKIEVSTRFALPIWGFTDYLVIEDTLQFNVKDFYSKDFERIQQLVFILNFRNRFPIEAQTQIYFADASGAILDSMFTNKESIKGDPQLDNAGKISPYVNPTIKTVFSKAKIKKIENTKYLKIRAYIKTLNSSAPESYKFFTEYYFYTHVGVAAEIVTNP